MCSLDKEFNKLYQTLIEQLDNIQVERTMVEYQTLDIDDKMFEKELAFLDELDKLDEYK